MNLVNGIIRIVYYSIDEGGEERVGYKGSGLAPRAWFPLITCEKGSAGSTGLEGSTVVVRRLKIWKRRGGLKLAVFSYRKPNP
ncbi:Uncharacterised protein [Bacteroides xylanisolvens]|nr:Uncharacterised protein [Bacteroides xylanisolvens]